MKGCRPFTNEERQKLRSCFLGRFHKRNLTLFTVGIYTGFRAFELLSLKVSDVYQKGKVLDYVTVYKRNMKKKVESRTVLLHENAKTSIKLWIKELKKTGDLDLEYYLFFSQGQPLKSLTVRQVQRILKQAYQIAGISGPVGSHSLRKTFALMAGEDTGWNIFKMQTLMGHKDPKSTSSYVRFMQNDLDSVIRRFK